MLIKIDELQRVINILLEEFKQSKGNTIELKDRYFWDIAIEDIYNPEKEPQEVTLGLLSDQWKTLIQILAKPDEIIPYDLKSAAEILKALSTEIYYFSDKEGNPK